MVYTTTMTQKGQITIPKEFRDLLGLKTGSKLVVSFNKTEKFIIIRPLKDIVDIAGTFSIKKQKNALKITKT